MQIIFKAETIANVLNALNRLTVTGLANAEIITYVIQELNKNETAECGVDSESDAVDGE